MVLLDILKDIDLLVYWQILGEVALDLKMENIDCFLDNNPHLSGRALFEKPILLPEDCPDHIDSVVFAVNPAIADQIIRITKEQLPKGKNLLRLVWRNRKR